MKDFLRKAVFLPQLGQKTSETTSPSRKFLHKSEKSKGYSSSDFSCLIYGQFIFNSVEKFSRCFMPEQMRHDNLVAWVKEKI